MKIRTNNGRLALPLVVATLAVSVFSGLGANPQYPSVVKGDGALGYYRFNDSLSRTLVNVNSGSLGAAGNATNDLGSLTGGAVYSMPGAIVGDGNRSAFYDFTTRTEIPWNAELNRDNTQPFSVEMWIYAVNDQVGNGMSPIANRLKPSSGSLRTGWVVFQRAIDTNHCLTCGSGLGWDFQMYNGMDGGTHLQVQTSNSITLGKWQHYVVVYDPVQISNATLTAYVDGVQSNTKTWNSDTALPYAPNANTNDATVSPHGQPAISLGGYNNSNPEEPYGFANPWTGGIDEFAYYTNKLTAAQVLAHYQNATNAARSTSYDTLVKADNPVVYLRLDEIAPGPDIAFNIGDARSASHATNGPSVKHPGTSALAGRTDDGSFTGQPQYTLPVKTCLADIPWNAGNNPDASVPFTIEVWLRPKSDYTRNGPSPVNNRLAGSAVNRTGWLIYQRDANPSYSTNSPNAGEGAVGWALRPYRGQGTGGGNDIISGGGYNVGEWMHVVFTWEPQTDVMPTDSGSEQWQGVMTAYTNGVAANTNANVFYAANVNPTTEAIPAADLAIGSYNKASNQAEEFDGDVDEFAFYASYLLSPAQIMAHYQAGTNAHPATSYEALVFNAGGDTYFAANGYPIPERSTTPKTYLRFNQPAYFPAANSGSLGYLADGSLVLAQNNVAGPVSAGFEGSNTSVPFDGTQTWVSLNNPAGLRISGQITLEAWIKPGATQTNIARVVSHGPPTPTSYPFDTYTFNLSGSQLSSNEVFLRLEGNGTTYSVGTSDGATFHGATAPVPAGVLGGSQWVHLAGTYDGSHWNLYTNGVLAKSVADATGALPVNAEWSIGSTGDGWPAVNGIGPATANDFEGNMEFFAGGIDEVAIYNTALSSAIIAAHYYVGQNGPVSLTITRSGSNVIVSFAAGVLQQATSLNGPWANVGGASPPSYSTAIGSGAYYRLRL